MHNKYERVWNKNAESPHKSSDGQKVLNMFVLYKDNANTLVNYLSPATYGCYAVVNRLLGLYFPQTMTFWDSIRTTNQSQESKTYARHYSAEYIMAVFHELYENTYKSSSISLYEGTYKLPLINEEDDLKKIMEVLKQEIGVDWECINHSEIIARYNYFNGFFKSIDRGWIKQEKSHDTDMDRFICYSSPQLLIKILDSGHQKSARQLFMKLSANSIKANVSLSNALCRPIPSSVIYHEDQYTNKPQYQNNLSDYGNGRGKKYESIFEAYKVYNQSHALCHDYLFTIDAGDPNFTDLFDFLGTLSDMIPIVVLKEMAQSLGTPQEKRTADQNGVFSPKFMGYSSSGVTLTQGGSAAQEAWENKIK